MGLIILDSPRKWAHTGMSCNSILQKYFHPFCTGKSHTSNGVRMTLCFFPRPDPSSWLSRLQAQTCTRGLQQLPALHTSSCTMEKAMAPHSSTLAWKIPWTEEPGKLQSMGSRRVRHDWATSLSLFTFMHWRRKWQPTPVFLPGESQGRGSLVGCCLWGRTELNTT